jgi:hypothetical protein
MSDILAATAPQNSAGPSPERRRNSIRRTSTIDTQWPDGRTGHLHMIGRARDAVTPAAGGPPIVCAEDEFRAELQWDRTIVSIDATPGRPAIGRLVGSRGGGHLRKALDDVFPEERLGATPLHLILDDLSGASLVAGWAWSRWTAEWQRSIAAAQGQPRPQGRRMEGICSGFRPGSSALNPDGTSSPSQSSTPVEDLRNPPRPRGLACVHRPGRRGRNAASAPDRCLGR